MISDFFKLAIEGVRRKGIRSLLTVLGIVIGITAVVVLVSLSSGFQNALNKQFELLGTNIIYIYPGSAFGPALGSTTMSDHDLDLIKRVHGVDLAGGTSFKISKIKYKNEIKYTYVIGLMTDESQDILLEQSNIKITGTQKRFKPNDMYKVAVGYLLTEGEFFDKPIKVGDNLFINDKKFQVIGTVSRIGNPSDDSQVYVPIKALNEVFNIKENEFAAIMVRVKDGWDVNKVAEAIKKELRSDRGLKEGEEDFQVVTLEQMREIFSNVFFAVQVIVIGIAAISLIVGGFNIMNSMYTSVLERTQEIGVMKAVGARNGDVLTLFLIESGTIGLLGGTIGCILGVGIAKAIEEIVTKEVEGLVFEAAITPELVFFALGFSFLVGSISGVLPAKQAAELKPTDALAYE